MRSAGTHRSENAGMSGRKTGRILSTVRLRFQGRLVRPGLVRTKERPKVYPMVVSYSPILKYVVKEGRSKASYSR